jgi:gas vesicle protein
MSTLPYEDEDRRSSSGTFLTGMCWGMAIGAVAALFFAPRRGSELRGQVADSVNRASRRAVDTYTRASETMTDFAGRAANAAGTLTDRAATLTAKLNQTVSDRRSSSIS